MINPKNLVKIIKNSQHIEPLALGLYVEGACLQAVWLQKKQDQIQLLGAETILLPEVLETVQEKFEKLYESTSSGAKAAPIDITHELEKMDLMAPELEIEDNASRQMGDNLTDITAEFETENRGENESDEQEYDTISIIRNLLTKYPDRKLKIAISIPEPQLYYSHFDTRWGLSGRKLKKKIVEEILKQKPGSENIKQEAMHNLELADGSLMTIARDSEIGLIAIIDRLRGQLDIRMPEITVVESAEISIVNLVKENYNLAENVISVIVYVGPEYSRLIFMKGNQLSHIAPIISEGIEPFYSSDEILTDLATKIRSRLLLEQDNLNISQIDNIILTGRACKIQFKNVFLEWFGTDVNIDPLKLAISVNDGEDENDVPEYPIACGAAWRAIDSIHNGFYNVDLIPFKIREQQKVLKLGITGWIMFALIPFLTFFFTLKISQLNRSVHNYQTTLTQKKSELAYLQDLSTKVELENVKYNNYVNTFGVLDSMLVGTYTWSSFLNDITIKAEKVGNVWITEISRFGPGRAILRGYAMDRKKIPAFADSLHGSVLKQVQIQEINYKTVFSFDIELEVKSRRPEYKKDVAADSTANKPTISAGNESIKSGELL